ncbi:hypothetical protein RhiXN_03707 [Rhizoctonia solani]|uniref:Uncharacterized protein n=1 Tax=Rhizoctonia solani TaxID=456999 RepID=A0A8H8NL13_9AGAM|nr:uncharacterized protein RhiXN_03707 [Rhizoctonia solani]QRW15706.1 hypothetical protein RhiXN_03707 [Rhizoctonia solani]
MPCALKQMQCPSCSKNVIPKTMLWHTHNWKGQCLPKKHAAAQCTTVLQACLQSVPGQALAKALHPSTVPLPSQSTQQWHAALNQVMKHISYPPLLFTFTIKF